MRKYRRVNEDILPDEVYNKAWENAKRTYVVTARGAAPYHYEINTEYGIYAKVPNDMGFLAHWFLDTRSRDTVEEMEELASKYIRKYNCKKVSVQEYKNLVDGDVKESYKRRIREARERHIKDLTDEELIALRKEIRLGSLFYRDYDNSFGIDEHEVCDFFDGFLEDAEDNFKYEFGRYPKDAGELYDYCDNDDALLTYANYMIEW